MLTRHRLHSGLRAYVALAVLALAQPLGAAVPGQVDFQGLLLDAAGEKVNGAVDLTFRLYDAPAAGTLLWTESHNDVQVADGVYGVTLGAVTPLTQSELGGGTVYLEIQVESETLAPRRQLLAVPYAIRAESADNVGGVAGGFYTEIIEHFDFDGGPPANDDPSEGTADVDGDGRANFIDADNDEDGQPDVSELADGTDINLVTPVISSVTPPLTSATAPQTISVQGSNFEAGITVAVGASNPVPTNVTPTSFDVVVDPQPIGSTTLVVTRVNGQSDSSPYAFYGRRVFLSNPTTGQIGGFLGRFDLCMTRALQLGLTGSYYAWLSNDPATQFNQTGGFSRIDGTKIADDWADLTDGTLDAPIVEGGTEFVWTGTAPDGSATGGSCSSWTSNHPLTLGLRGVSGETGVQWTVFGGAACNALHPVYCFEQ